MDPLLEAVLRKDRKKAGRQEVESFLSRLGAERKAKLAETSGALDALTLLPGAAAARAARAGSFGNAAVNALAFTSQFGDDPVSRLVGELAAFTPNLSGLSKMSKAARSAEFQKRLGQDYLAGGTVGAGLTLGGMAPRRETDENTAAFPVFGGVGTLGNLRRVAQRAAAKGKDLPQFDFEGKIAPRRQQELEQRMRAWIPKLSGKDPEGTTKKLDDWVKNNPFWGKYPLEKGPLLDLMPAELRQPFYQSLKEMGYGGTRMGERTALGSRGEKLGGRARNENFGEIPAFANRKWEDILKFEQGGGLPAGWAAANPGRQPSWVARPGEKLAPGQRNILDEYAKAAGGGGTAAALGAGIAGGMAGMGAAGGEGADEKAGLVITPRNIVQLRRNFDKALETLNKTRPKRQNLNRVEALFAAKYPKLYQTATQKGPLRVDPTALPDNLWAGGSFNPYDSSIYLQVPRESSKRWKSLNDRADVGSVIAHESLHATDLARMPSGLRAPGMPEGARMNFGDFGSPLVGGGKTPQDILDNWSSLQTSLRRSDYPKVLASDPGPATYVSLPEANRRGDPSLHFQQPVEARAYKGGKTASRSIGLLDKVFEQLDERRKKALRHLTAGTAGGLALGVFGADEPSEDDLAAVPGAKKFLRRLAMAQNPRLWGPQSNTKLPGSAAAIPTVWGAQRFENLADVLPGRQQRRGLYYTLAEPRPVNQLGKPYSAYENSFGDLLTPGSEGGSRGILGDAVVRKPLLIPSSSFFGWDADKFLTPKDRRGLMTPKSWEDLNKQLPKKYRLNNADIRNFKNDPNRPYKFNDTVGDLVLSKYLKAEGYDAGIPTSTRKAIQKYGPDRISSAEVIFPSESRWDLRPQFQPNWRTLETWAKGQKALPPEIELSLLKRGIKPAAMAAPASGSKLDSFAKQLGVEIPQGKNKKFASIDDEILDTMGFNVDPDFAMLQKATETSKPKMTKADRIAKWGNPGFKDPVTGTILFDPEDFFKYRLPNNSAVGEKSFSGHIFKDYSSPVFQKADEFGSSGGPKFYGSLTDPTTALELAKKGAKPLTGKYYPKKSQITEEQLEELKKLINVFPVD